VNKLTPQFGKVVVLVAGVFKSPQQQVFLEILDSIFLALPIKGRPDLSTVFGVPYSDIDAFSYRCYYPKANSKI
jgi:hypothetical protein